MVVVVKLVFVVLLHLFVVALALQVRYCVLYSKPVQNTRYLKAQRGWWRTEAEEKISKVVRRVAAVFFVFLCATFAKAFLLSQSSTHLYVRVSSYGEQDGSIW